jgi:hypothetical protein
LVNVHFFFKSCIPILVGTKKCTSGIFHLSCQKGIFHLSCHQEYFHLLQYQCNENNNTLTITFLHLTISRTLFQGALHEITEGALHISRTCTSFKTKVDNFWINFTISATTLAISSTNRAETNTKSLAICRHIQELHDQYLHLYKNFATNQVEMEGRVLVIPISKRCST